MSKLPSGWTSVNVGEIAEINPKNSLADETRIGFVPMNLLPTRFGQKFAHEKRKWGEVKKGYTHFRNGDVLLAKITPCFENGKSAIAEGLENGFGAGSTEYIVSRPHQGLVLPEFLLALFRTEAFLKTGAVNMTGSVGQKRIPKEFVESYKIRLPPLNEQKCIADKLDQTLAIVERAKARLARVPEILKQFRQSVLAAATDGRLTEDWREARSTNPPQIAELHADYAVVRDDYEPCGFDANACSQVPPPTGEARWGRVKKDAASLFDRPHPNLPPWGEGAENHRAGWRKVKFADVGELGRGKSKHRPRNDPRLYGGPYPFIQTGDVAQSRGRITTHSQTYSEFGLAQSKLLNRPGNSGGSLL